MKLTPEEVILQHAKAPYDPAKRRERYLRTRQLKGRAPGKAPNTLGSKPSGKPYIPSRTPRGITPLEQRRKQRRKEIEAQTEALRKRLGKLRKVLKELVKEAKRLNGEVVPDRAQTTHEPVSSTKQAPAQKLTTTEKRDAAKRSKDYYEKHVQPKGGATRDKLSSGQTQRQIKANIREVEHKIGKARADLKAAIARARNDTASPNRQ
jgi:hypothetical protein